jgi:hypothetical protein
MTDALEKHIVRETEKAVLIRCHSFGKSHDVWFPRSQIEIGRHYVFLPTWLAKAKARDAGKALGLTDADVARKIEAEALQAAA